MANDKTIDELEKAMLQRIYGRRKICPKCKKESLVVFEYEEWCTECKYRLSWHPSDLKNLRAVKISSFFPPKSFQERTGHSDFKSPPIKKY